MNFAYVTDPVKQCEGKKPFRSRKDAMRRVIGLTNSFHAKHGKPTSRLNVYECPHCGSWHIGHKRKGKVHANP